MKREQLSTDPLVEIWRLDPGEGYVRGQCYAAHSYTRIVVTGGMVNLFREDWKGPLRGSAELRPGEAFRLTALCTGAVLVVVWSRR